MKSIITIIAAFAVSAAFATAAEVEKKAGNDGDKKGPDVEKIFAKKDANSDGSISKEEFKAGGKDAAKAEKVFARKDKDGDGKISKDEFAAGRGRKKK